MDSNFAHRTPVKSAFERLKDGFVALESAAYPAKGHIFRRVSAMFLSGITLSLLVLSMLLSHYEGSQWLLLPLSLSTGMSVVAILWLLLKKDSALGPLSLLLLTVMLLGVELLLNQSAPNSSSLLWFIIFPPMIMFTMGLRLGTLLFGVFYLFLVVLMLTPLDVYLADQTEKTIRMRFLLAMLGAFLFSWCAEYTRYRIYSALEHTLSRLEQEALTDPLTGLGNRRDFQKYFAWVKAKSVRDHQPFSLAMLDIDHFKRVNDVYGHNVGDAVLIHFAEILKFHVRETDRLFRWGGEEFIILLPDTSAADARAIAERVRSSIENSPYRYRDLNVSYTVSIGLFSENIHQKNVNDPVVIADRNLYMAKSKGRNQVVG